MNAIVDRFLEDVAAAIDREAAPETPAERPIAVGDRVRVVRCCPEGTEYCTPSVWYVGREGVIARREHTSRPWVVRFDGWGDVCVAAVERVEPEGGSR